MSDDVFSELDQKIATMIRLAQEVGQTMRYRAQQAAVNESASANQIQQREMLALRVAHPYLSEGTKDRWWKEAEPEDAAHMMGLAERFRDADPTAEAVWIRGVRECQSKWGVDLTTGSAIPDLLAASDADVADAEPLTVTDQPSGPDQIREMAVETMNERIDVAERAAVQWESIAELAQNTNMPVHTREKLIDKVLPLDPPSHEVATELTRIIGQSTLSSEMKERVTSSLSPLQAEAELHTARSDVDALIAKEEELTTAVDNGETSAKPELASTRAALTHAKDSEADAEHIYDQAVLADAQQAAYLREDSFPVAAEEGIKQAGRAKNAPRSATLNKRSARLPTKVR